MSSAGAEMVDTVERMLPDWGCSRPWVRDTAWFIGETARPMAIGISATCTAVGFLYGLGVAELGVMATLTTSLYLGKVWEKNNATNAAATTKIAQTKPANVTVNAEQKS